MNHTLQYLLNRVQKVSVIPATAVFTQYEIDDISDLHSVTFGDAVHTLEYADNLKRYVQNDPEREEALDKLSGMNIYIDLEN